MISEIAAGPVPMFDAELSGPSVFTDAESILGRSTGLYEFVVEILAERAGLAARVRALTGDELASDPVVRAHLDAALGSLQDPETVSGSRVEDVLARAAEARGGAKALGPTAASSRHVVRHPVYGQRALVLWDDTLASSWFGARLLDLVEDRLLSDHANARLVPAWPSDVEAVGAALDVLDRVLPRTARSVVRHVTLLALVDGREGTYVFQSASMQQIPRTIFIRSATVRHPGVLAECLLHEALHHRLYDLYRTRSMLRPGYDAAVSPCVTPYWNARDVDSNRWPADRALAAGHVYVHLAAFFLGLARLNQPAGDHHHDPRVQRASERAAFLGRQLAGPLSGQLGPEGLAMAHWLADLTQRVWSQACLRDTRVGVRR